MKLPTGSPLALFVRALLPSFSKTTITQQMEVLLNELTVNVLPIYQSATEMESGFRGQHVFKDKWNLNANSRIMSICQKRLRNTDFSYTPQNCIEFIYQVVNQMGARLKYIHELINKSFNDDVVGSALSYKQASLLRLVELTEFMLVYARRILIYLVHNEYKNLEKTVISPDPFVKGDVKWLESNIVTFCSLLDIYAVKKEDFFAALKKLPDVQVAETKEEEDKLQQIYDQKSNPLNMGFIPYVLNPVFHIKNAVLHWRHSRLEAAKVEREMVELRLQQYMLKRNGSDNAKLEKVIEATTERLKKLNKKISDMEETWRQAYET